MKKQLLLYLFAIALVVKVTAQPFADVINYNYQTFSSTYKDHSVWKNTTVDNFLNFFLPKQFKNGNTLLIRLNTERISSIMASDTGYSGQYISNLSAISLPLGMKFVSKNKKWETIVIGIPKIAFDSFDPLERRRLTNHDFQYGGIFLEYFVLNPDCKIKAGLYYNREAFGNFFVPLVGVDWKVNKRLSLYGIMPTNYKVEYNIVKNKLYTGLNFKSFTRSFRLSKYQDRDYVRYNEIQVKLFLDCFVYKKILAFVEVGYTLGKSPIQYAYNTKIEREMDTKMAPVYMSLNPYPIFSVGLAYRVRLDLEK
jgi:hypothetical protein